MPTDADRDAVDTGAPEPQDTPAAPAAAPTFSLGDVQTLVRESVRSAVQETIAANRPAPQPRVDPEPEGATDEEFRDNPRAALGKELRRALHPVQREMEQFRTFGLAKLADVTGSVELAKLPFYKDYKTEIDAKLSTLDAALRTNPETLRLVHDTVVAQHVGEIQSRARDEGRRQAAPEAPAPGTAGPTRGRGAPAGTPTPAELGYNEFQLAQIEALGGPDAFAERISEGRTKSWKDFVAKRETLQTAPKDRRGRTVMPFKRLELKRNAIVGG